MISTLRVLTVVAAAIASLAIACGDDDAGSAAGGENQVLLPPDLEAAIQAGPVKEFPQSLRDDAEPLSAQAVVGLWTHFLSGTFVVDANGAVTEYCGDGSGARLGTVLGFVDQPGRVFEELRTRGAFRWHVRAGDTGSAWNTPVLQEDFNEKTLTIPDGNLFPGWAFSTNRLSVFENPKCGAIYVNPASARVVSLWEEHLETELTANKEFPPELMPHSDPLPWDEVVRLWTEWESDTLMIEDAGLVMEFCRGGTGNTLAVPIYGAPLEQPEPFEWSYHPNRGHPWYEPRLVIRDTGSRIQLHNIVVRPPVDEIATGPDPHIAAHSFAHPNCGQVVPDYEKLRRNLEDVNPASLQQCARQPFAEGC